MIVVKPSSAHSLMATPSVKIEPEEVKHENHQLFASNSGNDENLVKNEPIENNHESKAQEQTKMVLRDRKPKKASVETERPRREIKRVVDENQFKNEKKPMTSRCLVNSERKLMVIKTNLPNPNMVKPITTEQSSSMTGLQKNPLKWSCQEEMFEFVADLEGADIAEKFRSQQIDGRALDYLRVETLVEVLGLKLGCAARIKLEFDRIKSTFETQSF